MRTTYEVIKSLSEAKRRELMLAGIIPQQWQRYIDIYEDVTSRTAIGIGKMEAMRQAGEKYYTSLENVRSIMRKMQQPNDTR